MYSMRRRGFLTFFIAALLSPISSIFAAQSPMIKATELGQTTILGGKKFTVIRVKVKGKYQLIWNKGVAIPPAPKTSSSATPTTSPAPSATATPTPTTSPAPSATATPTPTPKNLGTALGDSSSLAVGETKFFEAKNRVGLTRTYIAYRSKSGPIVMSDICTHNGCSVKLNNEGLVCPCHNARFNPTSGVVERGPAAYNLDRFEVVEENGKIIVAD